MTAAARLFRVGRWHIRLAANTNSPQEVPSSQIRSSSTDFVMRGIVSKPSSWEEIKEKVNIGTVESLGTLGRLPDHIEIYRAFRKKKMEEWDSMGSYLHQHIWGWEPWINEDGKKSDFPYACEPGIKHHNIWCTVPLSDDQLAAVVEKHKPAAEYETLTFINPVELQSIRAIWHAHVFSRCRQVDKT